MPPPEFVLHIWPGKWSLPSVDPSCLAAVILFQSLIPGRFALSECVDPDSSPSGVSPRLHLYSTANNVSRVQVICHT
jgi:sorting and assembly machinery component 37